MKRAATDDEPAADGEQRRRNVKRVSNGSAIAPARAQRMQPAPLGSPPIPTRDSSAPPPDMSSEASACDRGARVKPQRARVERRSSRLAVGQDFGKRVDERVDERVDKREDERKDTEVVSSLAVPSASSILESRTHGGDVSDAARAAILADVRSRLVVARLHELQTLLSTVEELRHVIARADSLRTTLHAAVKGDISLTLQMGTACMPSAVVQPSGHTFSQVLADVVGRLSG